MDGAIIQGLKISAWEIAGQTSNFGPGLGTLTFMYRAVIGEAASLFIYPRDPMGFLAIEAVKVLGTMTIMKARDHNIAFKSLVVNQLKGVALEIGALIILGATLQAIGIA